MLFLWLVRSRLLRPARVVVAVLALAVTLLAALPSLERNTTFREGIIRTGTFSAREGYWQLALPVAFASPHNLVFGIGTGVLETPALYQRAPLPFLIAATPQDFEVSLHNEYVATLVEQGTVGLTALLMLLLSGFMPAARAARATRDATFAALAASILALAIGSTVVVTIWHQPSLTMLMVTVGLAATAASDSATSAGGVRTKWRPHRVR